MWSEAFAIFSFILVSHFPHHRRDLLGYQLLILRTLRHFSGRVWLVYNRAFCEHMVTTQLMDWSCMNAQLFNFHAAGASVCSPSSNDSSDWEPTGSSGSILVCKSWNRGVALRLSPSAATRTAAPSVLVRIVQQLVQLCGLRILGRTEKGMLRPLQLRVPPREASLAVLRVFSLFR